jgi:hypothetical protein
MREDKNVSRGKQLNSDFFAFNIKEMILIFIVVLLE